MSDLEFGLSENPWKYRFFWLLVLALFILPAWASRWWPPMDPWVVDPQVRLLEFVSPPLAEKWPIRGGLTEAHRYLFSIFYAIIGWLCVRLVSHQHTDWWLRIWWVFIYGAVAMGFFQVVAMLMLKFRAIPSV